MSLQATHANGLAQPSTEVNGRAASIHAYRPPNGATRSPCPCLNTLANHSYLPHDGRNITFLKLVSALQEGMGITRGFALFLAIGSFILLRRPTLTPFDLHGAGRHDFIEHNASMVHDDARPGEEYAPSAVDHQLLNAFLDMAHPSTSGSSDSHPRSVLIAEDIAERRVEREAVCAPLDGLHAELARGEFGMVLAIFGKGENHELDREELRLFLEDNRLPDGWSPSHKTSLPDTVVNTTSIRDAMREIREKAAGSEVPHQDGEVSEWFKYIVTRFTPHKPSS